MTIFDLLACPVDGESLALDGAMLRCGSGHAYPVVHGVPVLLRRDIEHTIGLAATSLRLADAYVQGRCDDPFFIDSLGISDDQKAGVRAAIAAADVKVDPVISYLIAATNGILYRHLVGRLRALPLPEVRLPRSNAATLLDLGCSWGRWSIGAARKGYRPIGLDPSLGAVLAAKRLAASLGLSFDGIVADARHIPLKPGMIDAAFSYSVLQHFSKDNAHQALLEVARVIRLGGLVHIQMASATGIRSLQHMARRRFREPVDFDVRYWSPWELKRTFRRIFGNAELSVDCFFGLGLQPANAAYMRPAVRVLLQASEVLRRVSEIVRPLAYVADSVYLTSRNAGSGMRKE